MAISKIPSAGFQDNVKFRNIIINGDMSIAQRRTLWEDFGNNDSGYVTVDRWKFVEAGTPTFECDISQSTTVPTGQGFTKSTKIDVTIADTSLASDDLMLVRQSFEGQNLQYLKYGTSNAQQLTCSFWVRSNKTGTYICNLEDSDNTKDVSQSYTINSADTWEKKTVTFPANTSDSFDNDNARSLDLVFFLTAGSNYTSGTLNTTWNTTVSANRAVGQVNLFDNTSNEWYITGVQLEAGQTASEFEFLPVDVNLGRCQRYYYKSTEGNANTITMIGGVESASSAGVGGLNLPVEMRASPTLSFNSGVRFYSAGSGTVTPSISGNRSTPAVLSAAVGISGGTAGQAAYVYRGAATGHVIGDAEL